MNQHHLLIQPRTGVNAEGNQAQCVIRISSNATLQGRYRPLVHCRFHINPLSPVMRVPSASTQQNIQLIHTSLYSTQLSPPRNLSSILQHLISHKIKWHPSHPSCEWSPKKEPSQSSREPAPSSEHSSRTPSSAYPSHKKPRRPTGESKFDMSVMLLCCTFPSSRFLPFLADIIETNKNQLLPRLRDLPRLAAAGREDD
jgi:hypothetical protein